MTAPAELLPLREKSVNGQPPETTSFFRSCVRCGASFIALAVGKTGLRGPWCGWQDHLCARGWWCSIECYDADHPAHPLRTRKD